MMASARSSLEQLTNSRPQFPQGLQVLLVEPSSDQHTLQQLQELQYVVKCVVDIPAAVAALTTSSIDVIMANLSLVGDLAGEDASRLFSTAGKIPVVLIGSQCSPSQVLAAVEHGAADVLEKPLSQLKLQNIWQHAVRAAMVGSSETRPALQAPDAAAVDELMAKHDAAADAAAAAAATLASSAAAEGLLQEQQRPNHPMVHSESCQVIDDCYKDLGLSAFLPQQPDPEGLFLDLEPPVQPGEPGLDAFLRPCTPSGSAAADGYSTEQVLTVAMCSSEQYGSGAAGVTAWELESCADTSTHKTSGMVSGSRSRGSMEVSAGCCDLQHSAMQSAAPVPATAVGSPQQQQQMLVPGCPVHPSIHPGPWGHPWGGRGVPCGMVWGMPVYTVARAPGLPVPVANKVGKSTSASGSASCTRERYPSCTGSAAASASSSPTHKSSCTTAIATATAPTAAGPDPYLPSMVPPMCWPVMPPQVMQPYAPSFCSAVATGTQPSATTAASQMPPYPGMFSGMYPPTMWPMCMYPPYVGMPGGGWPGMPGMGCSGVPNVGFPGMPGMPIMSGWCSMDMGTALSGVSPSFQGKPVLAAPSAACPTTAAVAEALAGGPLHQETITSSRAVAFKQNAALAGSHSIGSSLEALMSAGTKGVTAHSVDRRVDSKSSGGSDAFVDGLFVDDFRLSQKVEDLVC